MIEPGKREGCAIVMTVAIASSPAGLCLHLGALYYYSWRGIKYCLTIRTEAMASIYNR